MRLSDLVQKLLSLDGAPFSLKGRPYLAAVYNTLPHRKLLKCGRQTEKSTTAAAIAATAMLIQQGFRVLYVTPYDMQARQFSIDRLSPFINTARLKTELIVDNVKLKKLKNDSSFYARCAPPTAANSESFRGISSDFIIVDELQNMRSDDLPAIEQCISRSKYKWRLFCGTGGTYGSPIASIWYDSTQCEWTIKCKCGHENPIGIDESNISEEGLICSKCHNKLRVEDGRWVAYGRPDALWLGFHIPQLILPNVDFHEICIWQQKYSKAKFYQEVLGLIYEDIEQPISPAVLAKCETDRVNGIQSREQSFIGIDWGMEYRSRTAITVGTFISPSKFSIDYIMTIEGEDALDIDKVISQVIHIVTSARAKYVLADFGVGHQVNLMLAKRLADVGSYLIEALFVGSHSYRYKYENKYRRFQIPRSWCLSFFFAGLRQGRIELPRLDTVPYFKDEILSITAKEGVDSVKYESSTTDDTVFSSALCYFLASYMTGKIVY